MRVLAAGVISAADALARSLAVDGNPLALVVDSDSLDMQCVEERRIFLESSRRQVAPDQRWMVLVAVPELEVLFFEDRQVLKDLVGARLTESAFKRGKRDPRKVLDEVLDAPSRGPGFFRRLRKASLEPMRRSSRITELLAFIEKFQVVSA